MSPRIEDYALLGDCETAALIGRDGSIDWLCWPRFDSPSCFSALLGRPEHGRWRIAPCDPEVRKARRYRPGTLILETDLVTATGAATLIEFMPLRGEASDLIRLVVGRHGRVDLETELIVRFDYGSQEPWLTSSDPNTWRATAGPDQVILTAPVALHPSGPGLSGAVSVMAGETLAFILTYAPSHRTAPQPPDPLRALHDTEAFWSDWASRCRHRGDWAEEVRHSHVVLKALTYRPTGGLVAAPTTSLPERLGGSRNWDYRYCWLRDATFTLMSLMYAGYLEEADAWRRWLLRAIAGNPAQMRIMYGIAGERRLPEWTVPWLPGYEGSAPVRVGNAGHRQCQLDVFGEVMDALHQARLGGLDATENGWQLQKALIAYLESVWEQPDEGIWEVRAASRHFTYSKVMAWVALDRAVKGIERFGLDGSLDEWRRLRRRIHEEVCRNAYDPALGSFVQAYGAKELDASLLLLPLVGFLPARDPRVIGTVAAIERHLSVDGLVRRYDTHRTADGLPPGEGAFLACSFWLADNLVLQGRYEDARALFERLLGLRNDVGLLAEEYDPGAGRQLGNFPQAFSHLALANTARNLVLAQGPAEERSRATDP